MKEWVRGVFLFAWRDLARFWRNKFWLAGQIAMNIADLAIFGAIFRGIVRPDLIPDYIRFITPGVLCLSIFISAFSIGREVGVELRREVTLYLLSTPVRRSALVAGRLTGGVLRGVAYQVPFLILAIMIMGIPDLHEWVLIIFTTLALALTMSSISITLSTVTRDFNLQAALRSVTYFTLFFISNVFYPEEALKIRLGEAAFIARYSPITMATTIYRYSLGYLVEADIAFNIVGLLCWSLFGVILSYRLYIRNLLK